MPIISIIQCPPEVLCGGFSHDSEVGEEISELCHVYGDGEGNELSIHAAIQLLALDLVLVRNDVCHGLLA
jgi:hypothetical protein